MIVGLVLVAVGVAAGGAVYLLPDGAAGPVVTGAVVVLLGCLLLAVRGLGRRLDEYRRRQSAELAEIRGDLARQRTAEIRDQARLDAVSEAVTRNRQLLRELAELDAVATNVTREQVRAQRAELLDRLAPIERRLSHAATQTELRRLHTDTRRVAGQDFRQLEALLNLYALVPVRAPLPSSRRWAASPDLLLHLTALVLERRPSSIVELGGGLSTAWLAYALERCGSAGRIVSVDNDLGYSRRTRALLERHRLDHLVDVRHAPLVDVHLEGESWPWYDQRALADLESCDLLVVDGPPAAVRKHARYPAIPVLADRLRDGAIVVLDDCVRDDEKEIVERWHAAFPHWLLEMLDHEKGTAVFTVRSAPGAP